MDKKENIDEMIMPKVLKFQGKKIKIEKTKDYYNVFLSVLKVENEGLRNNRHYWVLGLDENGYLACVYIFSIDPESLIKISLRKIFRVALILNVVDVVIAYNVREDEPLIPSPENIQFFNRIYNSSDNVLEFNLLDTMVISMSGYHSDIEDGYFNYYEKDLTFKIVNDVKKELDIQKKKYAMKKAFRAREKGKHEEKIGIAKSMLAGNIDINIISKHTGLSEKEIENLK